MTVAGSGAAGFDGDLKQATQAALHWPNAVAVARNGDLHIADTMNHRVRVVSRSTGLILNDCWGRQPGPDDRAESSAIGDGGPAVRAHLNGQPISASRRMAMAIADMGHNRIRRVNGVTGAITTVAGNGLATSQGDGGLAAAALGGPGGPRARGPGKRLTIFVAEYFAGKVRVDFAGWLDLDARVSRAPGGAIAPGYRPDGWLYVASESGAVTAENVSPQRLLQVGHRHPGRRSARAVAVAVQAVQ